MEENILITTEGEPLNQTPKRPQLLTVLCILSYIWSGIVILCLFLCLIFSSFIFEVIGKIISGDGNFPTIDAEQQQAMQMLLNLGQGAFVGLIAFAIIVYMTSLLGVIKMWKLQKWGFYIYAAVNGLGAIYSVVNGSFFMAIVSLIFIVLYYMNFKDMK